MYCSVVVALLSTGYSAAAPCHTCSAATDDTARHGSTDETTRHGSTDDTARHGSTDDTARHDQDGDYALDSRWSCSPKLGVDGALCTVSYDLGGVYSLSEIRLGRRSR